MDDATFGRWLRQAKQLRTSTDDPEIEAFWRGYIRGLREAQQGDNRGGSEEHVRNMRMPEDFPDAMLREIGRGYRAGYRCEAPEAELVNRGH